MRVSAYVIFHHISNLTNLILYGHIVPHYRQQYNSFKVSPDTYLNNNIRIIIIQCKL